MNRRWFVASVGGAVLALPGFARAQSRFARVAVLLPRCRRKRLFRLGPHSLKACESGAGRKDET